MPSAFMGFLAAGLVLITPLAKSRIRFSDPTKEAAVAGIVLMSTSGRIPGQIRVRSLALRYGFADDTETL